MTHPKFNLIDSPRQHLDLVVIGGSAGALDPLCFIMQNLPEKFKLPLAIVLHRPKDQGAGLCQYLISKTGLPVREAVHQEPIRPGSIYLAPRNHHLLIAGNRTFSLSRSKPIRHSRPSIDILFNSAANHYRSRVLGILLSGANSDGSLGLKKIRDQGGIGIIQNPALADLEFMPKSSLEKGGADYVFNQEQIAMFLNESHERLSRARPGDPFSDEGAHGDY